MTNIIVPSDGQIIATIRGQDDMVEAFRKMRDLLSLTNAHCDELACMTEGHTDKVLGPSREKEIGPLTFGKLCWLFAVKFQMVVDIEQAKVMAEHWEDRQRRRPPEYSETKRISAKLLEKAKPYVLQGLAKVGNQARNAKLTGEHRSKLARKAAKVRWKRERAKKHPKVKASGALLSDLSHSSSRDETAAAPSRQRQVVL